MIKIKSYKISRRGDRGVFVSLPSVWVRDLNLKPGEILDVYRDRLDRLIIVPPGAAVTGGAARSARQTAPGRKRA